MKYFSLPPKALLLSIILWMAQPCLFANNIQVSNVKLTGQDVTSHFSLVQFDISWDNSWRTSTLESNWDAAWFFVKFRKKGNTDWSHCLLNNTGHTAPAGTTITPGLVNTAAAFNPTTNPAVGTFLYRSANGAGNVNYTGVKLRWNYGIQGLADYDSVEVCVFALEMVYIPQGSFYVGDDNALGASTSSGHFVQGTGTLPFQITSEAAITINNTATTELWGTSVAGNNTIGGAGTLAASFPKGYGAFYIMKYELSQLLYKEYLNKLTRTQQAARVSCTTVGNFMNDDNVTATPQNRNGIKVMSDPGGASARVYGNDLNDNGTEGEADDGQHIACNWLSANDVCAFADWCGLRPFTELEYEKACRGILNPVTNERAWGSTNETDATGISFNGQTNEVASNSGANIAYGNLVGSPMRCGNFAQAATNREQSGASYYGVMEMSGNVWEQIVSVGISAHRTFDGTAHGNGSITAAGTADVTGWTTSLGHRGGSLFDNTTTHYISDRSTASISTFTGQNYSSTGIRVGRTAP